MRRLDRRNVIDKIVSGESARGLRHPDRIKVDLDLPCPCRVVVIGNSREKQNRKAADEERRAPVGVGRCRPPRPVPQYLRGNPDCHPRQCEKVRHLVVSNASCIPN